MPAAGGGKAQQHSPDNIGATAMRFFEERGLSTAQAAGIVGNLQQESGLSSRASGGLLAQWLGARFAGLEAFAHAHGGAPASGRPEVQLAYIWQELNTSERGSLEALRRTRTPQEAARVFSEQYERPSDPQLAKREKYAGEWAKRTQGRNAPGAKWGGPIGEAFGAVTGAAETAITAPIEAGEAVGEGVSGVVDLIRALFDPNTWLRFAEGVGGMVLLAMGLKTLTRGSGTAGPLGELARQGREATGVVAGAAAVVK